MADLTNLEFGRLFVVREGQSNPHNRRWICICDCGKICLVQHSNLTTGHSQSCGCQRPSGIKHHNYKHGKAPSGTYNKWRGMRQRCYDVNSPKYPIYGSRGISICKRWDTFLNFLTDMGKCPQGLTLGRINNDGNYTPNNCRWETGVQQQNNTRRNKHITCNGVTLTIAQWSRKANIPYKCLWKRLKDKWPVGKALYQPVAEQNRGQMPLFGEQK